MDNSPWELVLIEWANCLNLANSIQSIGELRDGEFFKSLLKIVSPSFLPSDGVTFVLNLLKAHYPSVLFDTSKIYCWMDVSQSDLLSITSLLLHHTCVTDRREVLTSPLCHRLPQTTQLAIKLFLEKVDCDITKDRLHEVIELCTRKKDATPVSGDSMWTISSESPVNSSSPLHDLLMKTPNLKKSRLLDRDREIKQLKTELELERYEKADIQEELRLQQEKNEKLDKELSKKTNEIKKLRGQLLILENKTPPHFNESDSMQIQRRLKAEVDNLETYIRQLETEQCDLEKQRDLTCEKLKNVEQESAYWQSKALSLETTCESLIEKAQQQELEINNLRTCCNELTEMLDELKNKKDLSDSFADWNDDGLRKYTRNTQSGEDLAQTVVDLQLKELQKENGDLRISLNNYVAKESALNAALYETKTKCEEQTLELLNLQNINTQLSEKVSFLNCIQESLETTEEKLYSALETIKTFETENANLKESVLTLQNKSQELTEALAAEEGKVAKLNEEVSEMHAQQQCYQADVEKGKKELCALKELLKQTTDEYEQKVNHLKTNIEILETDIESMRIFKEECSRQGQIINQQNGKIECLIKEVSEKADEIHAYRAKQLQLTQEIALLTNSKADVVKQHEKLNTDFAELQGTNKQLSEEISLLNNTQESLKIKLKEESQEKQKLTKYINENCVSRSEHEKILEATSLKYKELLQQHEANIEEGRRELFAVNKLLKQTTDDYEEKMEQLNNSVKYLNTELESMRVFSEECSQKDEIIKKQNIKIQCLVKEMSEKVEEINTYKATKLQLTQEIVLLNNCKADVLQKLDKVNTEFLELQMVNKQLSEEVSILNTGQETLKLKLEEVCAENQALIEDINRNYVRNSEHEKILDSTKLKFEGLLQECEVNIEKSRKEILAVNELLKQRNLEYEQKVEHLNASINNLNTELKKMSIFKKVCAEKDDIISQQNARIKCLVEEASTNVEELDAYKAKLLQLTQEIELLNDSKAGITHQWEKLNRDFLKLEMMNRGLSEKLSNSDETRESLKIKLEEERAENQTLIENINKNFVSRSQHETTLETTTLKYDTLLKECKTDIEKYRGELCAVNALLKQTTDKYEQKVQQLTVTIDNLNTELERLRTFSEECARKDDLINQQNTKIECLVKELSEKLDEINTFRATQVQLTEEITLLNNCKADILQQHQKLKTDFEELQNVNKELSEEVSNLNNTKEVLMVQLKEVYTEKQTLTENCISKSEHEKILESTTLKYEQLLHECEVNIEKGRTELCEVNKLLNETIVGYEQKVEQLNSTIDSLNTEIEKMKVSSEECLQKDDIINQQHAKIECFVKEMNEKAEEIATYRSAQLKLREEIALLNSSKSDVVQQHEKLNKDFLQLQVANKQLSEEISIANNTQELLKIKLKEITLKYDSIIQECEVDIEKSRKELCAVKELLKQTTDEYEQKVEHLNITINTLNCELERMRIFSDECTRKGDIIDQQNAKIECLVREVSEKVEELNVSKATQLQLSEEIALLNNFKADIVQKHEKLNMDFLELHTSNKQLSQEVSILNSTQESLKTKLKEVQTEKQTLMENINRNYISKSEHEKILKATASKYKTLLQECEELASKSVDVMQEKDGLLEAELKKLRDGYGNLMSEKSRLELELEMNKQVLQESTTQVKELLMVQEAYEKLIEENNKLMTELDTLNYKRKRDREEYLKALQKEKDEGKMKENKRVKEIRAEYETKLEKMKEKMVKLYNEEMEKEMQKIASEKNENVYLMSNIEQLRASLKEANLKIHETELERDKAIDKIRQLQKQIDQQEVSVRTSRESLRSLNENNTNGSNPKALAKKSSNNAVVPLNIGKISQKSNINDRRGATLPKKTGTRTDEENRMSRKSSVTSLPSDIGNNLKMEDEEDDFNNKYLSDLKEGRCVLGLKNENEKECDSERLSELAWRNSLCPPHLKSSYPAELQFASPARFKEDDIKSGNLDFDDSMSTKLLPGEKQRNKKDMGTTSYKKPGPPTPSKNGGRISLQGNEIHPRDVLHSNGESRTPKRVTPSRIKALFSSRGTSNKENSESQSTTPKARRLSNIFRKPR